MYSHLLHKPHATKTGILSVTDRMRHYIYHTQTNATTIKTLGFKNLL